MILNRVQRRFLSLLAKGTSIAVGSAAVTAAVYAVLVQYLGLEHKDALGLSMLCIAMITLVTWGVRMLWDRAEWEVYQETRQVEDALKGRL